MMAWLIFASAFFGCATVIALGVNHIVFELRSNK